MSHTAAPLSAGTLFYLWGDRVVDASGALGGHTLPSGARISTKQLAPLLFAVSLARLQGDGALRLEAIQTKTLGFTRHNVQITPAAQPGPRGGDEQAIVDQVVRGATTAHDVVYRWYDRDHSNPESAVFELARQEMAQCGLAAVQANARRGLSGMVMGTDKTEPLPDRIATTWGQFEQFHAWWGSYQRHDPAFVETLLDTCGKAIRNRRESHD